METILSTQPCKICGVLFAPGHHNQAYCSDECRRKKRAEHIRQSRERVRKGRFCKCCGKSLTGMPNRQVYCSYECKRGIELCEQCGNEFVPTPKSEGRFCSTECFYENVAPTGTINDFGNGYKIIKVPLGTPGAKIAYGTTKNRWMLAHRYVMQQTLGRPLEKREHVHHLNGVRDDNRPENLELWGKSHPFGVRQIDGIKNEILELTSTQRKQLLKWMEGIT